MALKFLNKKGWHTGSLRNIENVWKAEQKHDAEQKKLEELRKQIHEERERNEFRLLQEQAGIIPRQERLEFLYDSGLSVGKGSSEGVLFKSLEKGDGPGESAPSSSAQASASAVPGSLFEDKPQSANDTWRKLHSDPLLLIRKREQEALSRIKNNPVQMAMIRKSVGEKNKDKHDGKEERRKKRHHKDSKRKKHLSSEPADSSDASDDKNERRKKDHKSSDHESRRRAKTKSEDEFSDKETRRPKILEEKIKHKEQSTAGMPEGRSRKDNNRDSYKRNHDRPQHDRYHLEGKSSSDVSKRERISTHSREESESKFGSRTDVRNASSNYKRRNMVPKISEEERLARLKEMQVDAELHEEQRWKRLRKAEDNDAREANQDATSRGKSFLDAVQKSVYGAEKGGSSTIEKSVRRRTYYSQHRSQTVEGNAFRWT